MKTFQEMYDFALKKKGGEKELKQLLPNPLSQKKLASISDDRFLSQMTKSIFQAGFVWRVVESKWDGFEAAFKGFHILKNAKMSNAQMEKLYQDKRIIRNPQKIVTVRQNAQMILDIQKHHKSFAQFVAEFPGNEQYELFLYLKEHGSRLGGISSQYFLRFMGKDVYALTNDVVKELKNQEIITGGATSKSSLIKAQKAFNQWKKESKLKYSQISKIVAIQV